MVSCNVVYTSHVAVVLCEFKIIFNKIYKHRFGAGVKVSEYARMFGFSFQKKFNKEMKPYIYGVAFWTDICG